MAIRVIPVAPVTEQALSFLGARREDILRIRIKDVELKYLSAGDQPLSLGDLEGNEFIITLRNIEKEKIELVQFVPNYFDEQRFGRHNPCC